METIAICGNITKVFATWDCAWLWAKSQFGIVKIENKQQFFWFKDGQTVFGFNSTKGTYG